MELNRNAALVAAWRKACTNTRFMLLVEKRDDGFTITLFDLTGENPSNLVVKTQEEYVPEEDVQYMLGRVGKLVSHRLGPPPIFFDEENGPEGERVLTLVKENLTIRQFGGERRVVSYTQQG